MLRSVESREIFTAVRRREISEGGGGSGAWRRGENLSVKMVKRLVGSKWLSVPAENCHAKMPWQRLRYNRFALSSAGSFLLSGLGSRLPPLLLRVLSPPGVWFAVWTRFPGLRGMTLFGCAINISGISGDA